MRTRQPDDIFMVFDQQEIAERFAACYLLLNEKQLVRPIRQGDDPELPDEFRIAAQVELEGTELTQVQ